MAAGGEESVSDVILEYNDTTKPCLVARSKCGHYNGVCSLDVRFLDRDDHIDCLRNFIKEAHAHEATLEIRPVAFIRGGGLDLCDCAGKRVRP